MVLFLHVGQGGNAVGACFWQHAARERGPRRWLLDASGRCRCVLVDTEPKAVHAAVQAVGPQRLHARCALVERGGRGGAGDGVGRGPQDACQFM